MKESKVTKFIQRKKGYIIIAFLVLISLFSTSFALFRQDIIGQNTYSMEVVDLIPTISSNDLVNNSITLEAGETKEIIITVTNNDPIDAKFNLYYESTNIDIWVEYNNNDNIPATEGTIIKSNESLTYTILIRNPGTSSGTITFGSNGGFTTNELEFPSDKKIINNIPGCDDLDIYDLGIPNPPELVGDMIPVIYNEETSNWIKADITNSNNSWYNYDEQMWANAVTVTSTNRATYVAAEVGTTIPMEDINTFMVWIPRYSYTIGNTYGVQGCGGDTVSQATPGGFDIKFIPSDTTELGTASYTGSAPTDWFTNSAFCWGNSCDDLSTRSNSENRELSGIWVAKFETSFNGCSSKESCESNTIEQPIILPNVHSWRSVNISTAFNSASQYMNSSNGLSIYGLSGSTYNAHMIKNTEWGSLLYLTQSRYGRYGNENYTSFNKEIYQNKNSSYITGNSNGTPSQEIAIVQCQYNEIIDRKDGIGSCGGGASTTGNISGVYDISGGTSEYVMANMQDSRGSFFSSSSGFTSSPELKYYNSYEFGTSTSDLTRFIKGDGTIDLKNFYIDGGGFVYNDQPWFYRSGYYANVGIDGFSRYQSTIGRTLSNCGFRITLVP